MCNDYRNRVSARRLADQFREIRIPLRFEGGIPNIEPRDDIRITDTAPIVRTVPGDREAGELVQRRWSWPGPGGRPVYNFRSEGREFGSGRCLIIADGFYEFTTPKDAKGKRKDRWLFTYPAAPMIGIAGLTRTDPAVGEAFTMLTTEPGPDVAPYHGRQIAVLPPERWRAWLDPAVPARELLRRLPAGTLDAQPAPR